jgi:hypothetical protein
MYPSISQFGDRPEFKNLIVSHVNKGVSNSYKQLNQQISYQLKERKLQEQTCYPWQLDCNWTPQGLSDP